MGVEHVDSICLLRAEMMAPFISLDVDDLREGWREVADALIDSQEEGYFSPDCRLFTFPVTTVLSEDKPSLGDGGGDASSDDDECGGGRGGAEAR